jgi:DNA-binding transcriptional regulator YhcF (GntR family)
LPRHTLNSIIDQDSNIPLSIQVIDSPTDFIECIKFLLGYQVPAGAEPCHSFAVSHTINHQALKDLEYKGPIYRKRTGEHFMPNPELMKALPRTSPVITKLWSLKGIDVSWLQN